MNPLVAQALGAIVRWALTFLSAWFVQHGIWTSENATEYSAGAALAIVALGWSLWQKYKNRLKFLTALESPPGTTEAHVEAKVSTGTGATLGVLLALGLSIGVASCASAGGPLVAADRAVHAAVSQVQDRGDYLCDKKILSEPACKKFNVALVPIIVDADAFNRAVRSNSTAEVPTMALSLNRLVLAISDLLPDDAQRAELKAQLDQALALLRSIGGK